MYEYNCRIARVVDGDTADVDIDLGFGVWMHKERIRFYGIDTPESRTSDKEEKKYGNYAKQVVQNWLPKGSIQTLITKKDKTGKYGRILGQFKVYDMHEGKDIILNDWMIENHIGVAYFGQTKEAIQTEHLANREKVNLDVGFMLSEKKE